MSTATKIEWTRSDDGTAGATWNLAGDIQIIAVDCRTFLQRLEIAVETFAATGDLVDL
jgi:hypothetical protein